MARGTKALALTSAVVLGAGILAGCSSSGSDQPSALSSTATLPSTGATAALPSAAPSSSVIGGDPSTWTPVDISQADDGGRVKLVVGQAAVFTDLPPNGKKDIVVRAKPKGVVTVSQQTDTTNAGLVAVAPGKATVNVWRGTPKAKNSKILYSFTVKVTEVPATGAGSVGSASASAAAQ